MNPSKIVAIALLGGSTLVSANCNIAGCIAGLETAGIVAAASCSVAEFTAGLLIPADIACIASIAADIGTIVGACSSCTVAGACAASDQKAKDHGCGSSSPGGLELGPKHCAQLKSSAPRDKPVFGKYVFHCDNHGLVVNQDGATCYWPCSSCDQCTNPPPSIKGRMVDGPA